MLRGIRSRLRALERRHKRENLPRITPPVVLEPVRYSDFPSKQHKKPNAQNRRAGSVTRITAVQRTIISPEDVCNVTLRAKPVGRKH